MSHLPQLAIVPAAARRIILLAAASAQPTPASAPLITQPLLRATPTGTMFQLVGGTAAAVLIFGIPGALLLKAATEEGGEGQGSGRRALLLAAGLALELITVNSWGVTLYNLMGQR